MSVSYCFLNLLKKEEGKAGFMSACIPSLCAPRCSREPDKPATDVSLRKRGDRFERVICMRVLRKSRSCFKHTLLIEKKEIKRAKMFKTKKYSTIQYFTFHISMTFLLQENIYLAKLKLLIQ